MKLIAKKFIDSGWAVVPLRAGTKKAKDEGYQHKTYAPEDFEPSDNIAARCGEPSGWRVDVDLDCPEAILAAPEFLPPTGLVHGRPSAPLPAP